MHNDRAYLEFKYFEERKMSEPIKEEDKALPEETVDKGSFWHVGLLIGLVLGLALGEIMFESTVIGTVIMALIGMTFGAGVHYDKKRK